MRLLLLRHLSQTLISTATLSGPVLHYGHWPPCFQNSLDAVQLLLTGDIFLVAASTKTHPWWSSLETCTSGCMSPMPTVHLLMCTNRYVYVQAHIA